MDRIVPALTVLLAVAPSTVPEAAAQGMPAYPMDGYTQRVEVQFTSATAAQRAVVKVAPLYHDLRAAFSSRWDDRVIDDLRVWEVMQRYNQKGTFYLTDPLVPPNASQAQVIFTGDPNRELTPKLLAGGNSVGGHSLTHEYLTAVAANRAFREIMGIRVAQETNAQTPVCCFTYPFVAYRSEIGGLARQAELEEMLLRSGCYFQAEHQPDMGPASRLLNAYFISCDGGPWWSGNDAEAQAQAKRQFADRPLFLSTMHAWPAPWGGSDFPKLAEQYAKWGQHKDWWYCNQNEYAAYRYQFLHTKVEARPQGTMVMVDLQRPDPLELNDLTPLTLLIGGVTDQEVTSVSCSTAAVARAQADGQYAVDLFHDRTMGLPQTYAKIDNPRNGSDLDAASPQAMGLRALLQHQGTELSLLLENRSAEALKDIRVTFRLPLRWEPGVAKQRIAGLPPGGRQTIRIALRERMAGFAYAADREYDVAQVDFAGKARARLYATCEVEPPAADPSYPRDGFIVLGPLPADRTDFDLDRFAEPLLRGGNVDRQYRLFGDVSVQWQAPSAGESSLLDPNIVWTTGKAASATFYTWDPKVFYRHGKDLRYLLWGKVIAPADQALAVVCSPAAVMKLTVNGEAVEANHVRLKRGSNDIRILYGAALKGSGLFSERCYGAYLQLVNANGQRAAEIRFQRPEMP